MATINTKTKYNLRTHEGGKAKRISPEKQLERSVLACLLWEDSFYEDGYSIAERISEGVGKVKPEFAANMAIEARRKFKLRHVPLLIARELLRYKHSYPVSYLLEKIIQRPDEITEFLAICDLDGKWWKSSNQIRKGIGKAFTKFDEYQLAKYNRDTAITLRDALFISHAKPVDELQAKLWKRLADKELQTPDTWEVSLSTGKNKKETWTRLLSENKLGALALLRNLRNMLSVDVDVSLIKRALDKMRVDRVLPFRFISAAKYAMDFEPELEKALFKSLSGMKKFAGKTILLVDVSGSMDNYLSCKATTLRVDAATGLAMLLRELAEDIKIFSFSEFTKHIPSRHGFALRDAIINSQRHWSTHLGAAVDTIDHNEKYDRLIVITDEQAHDDVGDPKGRGYMLNVASYENGVGYGKWLHIDGWSEAVVNYIYEYEKEKNIG